MFEAAIEGVTQNQARGKSLLFEVSGEGNLPRVSVNKPTVRNKRGQPLLLFKKVSRRSCRNRYFGHLHVNFDD
jgi:hydrocephalus-inducing protein